MAPPRRVRNVAGTWSRLGADLAAQLAELVRRVGARVVGIGGAAGSGKSTLARGVASSLEGTVVVSTDDYYLSKDARRERGLRFRGPPGSHDVEALVAMLEGFRSGRRPLVVHRFSSERDDTLPAETYNDLPDHLIVEGLILGYRGDGYGRVLDLIDLFVFLDVDAETAKARRFAREAELRDHGGGFTENEMQSFWDEVLEPALHRWVADARERADVVISIGRDNEVTVVSANEAVMAALEHR